ncbi:MAG TPA: PIN domain nuclease [Terriglobia bacterium]|nr:PIN domain nuclease [Terriglobia bacterium]
MIAPSPILVDTSVWIDFFSRSPGPAGNKLRLLIQDAAPLALAGIIVTAILQGLTRDAERIENYLSQWGILEPEGLGTYLQAAGISRLARSKGVAITTVDALIASLAVDHGVRLFTLDKDFLNLARVIPLELFLSDS